MTEPRHTKKAGPDTVVRITRACTQGTEYVSDNDITIITIVRQQKNRQECSIKMIIILRTIAHHVVYYYQVDLLND